MRRKIIGTLCMLLGAALLLASLALVMHNRREDDRAGEAVWNVLPDMVAVIEENAESAQTLPTETQPPETVEEAWEMTVTDIDGHGYIGYLTIPGLDLELPVMAEWSYPKLKIAPCRQFGTTRGNDLVIAGHNYQRHFGGLSKLTDQDVVFFTDMEGEVTCYRVSTVDVIPPNSTEEVENSPFDLILYTCTYGGKNRVMMGAKQITKAELDALLERE